jgi:Asp/Glu/hydantoin racemase
MYLLGTASYDSDRMTGQPEGIDQVAHEGRSMVPTFVLVHTIPALVDLFTEWCRDLLPELRTLHVLDEPMLERINRRGTGAPEDDDRLAEHVALAQSIGAAGVLVTCSTVSHSVASIRDRFEIPVFAIDDRLATEAVAIGSRIAVVATAPSTLEPSRTLLEATAARAGRGVSVSLRVVDDALAALVAGDGATHDRLVERAIVRSAPDADVVVLAQASMARVLRAMADRPLAIPVLASPFLALAEVRRVLVPDAASTPAWVNPEARP